MTTLKEFQSIGRGLRLPVQITTTHVHINAPRRGDPRTDDTRQMMDDLRRVGPLPRDSLDRIIKAAAKQISEQLDRDFLKAMRGVTAYDQSKRIPLVGQHRRAHYSKCDECKGNGCGSGDNGRCEECNGYGEVRELP